MRFCFCHFTGILLQEGKMMKTTKELLGARVKELRKARGLSQDQLAEMIGIEPKHVSRIEVGKSYPTLDRLERIAIALDVPMKTFFDFMHLENDTERLRNIDEMIMELDEGNKKIIYKIVQAFKEC
jgi:transcriptional regulator with XRE-family HTH domain